MKGRLLLSLLFLTGCASSVSMNNYVSYTDDELAEIVVNASENMCNKEFEKGILDGRWTRDYVLTPVGQQDMYSCVDVAFERYINEWVIPEFTKVDDLWYTKADLAEYEAGIDYGQLFVEGVAFALEQEANYQQRKRDAELRNLRAQVKALNKRRQMRDLGLQQ